MSNLHGITRHSPSSLGLFCASPALYVLERVLKRRQPVGAPAHRGTAVEAGVAHGLLNRGADPQECVEIAERRYRELMALNGDPRREKYGDGIAAMVLRSLTELRPYGPPSAVQKFVECKPEGLRLPVVGYLDFEFEDHGVIVDLKTTAALPSQVKPAHAKQVSFYCPTDNHGGLVTYVTPAKSATYRVENGRQHKEALFRIAQTVERFLSLSSDPMELAGLVCPDVEHFYFADPQTRQAAFEVFGI